MTDHTHCPACQTSFQGEPVPYERRLENAAYTIYFDRSDRWSTVEKLAATAVVKKQGTDADTEVVVASGALDLQSTHYSTMIGVEVWGQYDGVLYWQCPACRHAFHRWPKGHALHQRAKTYIAQQNVSIETGATNE